MSDIKLELNTDELQEALQSQIDAALTAIGMQAETYAKQLSQVDTGRQRNSITFALHGQPANISTYSADRPKGNEPIFTGSYAGVAPDVRNSVYIGTNVPYAEINEFRGAFLRPALLDHAEEYKGITEEILEKE